MGLLEANMSDAMIPLTAGFVLVASAICVAAAVWNLIPRWFSGERSKPVREGTRHDVRTLLRPTAPPDGRAPREQG